MAKLHGTFHVFVGTLVEYTREDALSVGWSKYEVKVFGAQSRCWNTLHVRQMIASSMTGLIDTKVVSSLKVSRGVFSSDQTFENSNRFLRGLLTLLPDQIQSDINGTEGILLAAITTHNLSLLYLYVEGQVSSTHSSLKRM